jgi:hypothetical protein
MILVVLTLKEAISRAMFLKYIQNHVYFFFAADLLSFIGISQHIKSASSTELLRWSTVKAKPQSWQTSLLPFFIAGLSFAAFLGTTFFATDVFWAFTLDVAIFLPVVLFAAVFFSIAMILYSPFHSARSQRLMRTVYQISDAQ